MKKWWKRSTRKKYNSAAEFLTTKNYTINCDASLDAPQLVGLSVENYGRMGNNLLQISNALLLARCLDLRFLKLPKTELFDIDAPFEEDELTLLPSGFDSNSHGIFLNSYYYGGPRFERLGIRMPLRRQTLKKYLVPAVQLSLPEAEPAGCLTIHIRSGDIFGSNPHPDYAQPPLAFYRTAIENARETFGIDRVRLVFQDRRNPCVNALEAHLNEINLPYSIQNGTLSEDFSVLMAARHLVFGYGTFGLGICLLSDAVETVSAFGVSGLVYNQFDSLTKVHIWGDTSGQYPRKGEWLASPDQLKLMLNLPQNMVCEMSENSFRAESAIPWWILPDENL